MIDSINKLKDTMRQQHSLKTVSAKYNNPYIKDKKWRLRIVEQKLPNYISINAYLKC